MMDARIRLSRSVVGREEADAASRVILEDGYLGMGKEVQAFEQEIAAYLGVAGESVCCVNSGTAALHLAVQALTSPGDEVLVQSLTFLSSFQAISAAGAVPVACEVNEADVTVSLADAETRLTDKTRAIMPVHYAGNPGDLAAVYAFARQHGLRVIEDAAHAFGGTYDGRKVGAQGDVVCFSFDGIKNITSGEGGAIVCNDATLMAEVRDTRLLGIERDTEQRYAGKRSWDFEVHRQGYRYHMSNLFAAVGRVQLRRLGSEFADKRVRLSRLYRQRLAGVASIRLLNFEPGDVVPHIMPIRVSGGKRDAVREALAAENIESGVHYKPNHLLALYGGGTSRLPVTERLYEELLTLPLHPLLDEGDVERVCRLVIETIEGR